jgi:hypothetical protein
MMKRRMGTIDPTRIVIGKGASPDASVMQGWAVQCVVDETRITHHLRISHLLTFARIDHLLPSAPAANQHVGHLIRRKDHLPMKRSSRTSRPPSPDTHHWQHNNQAKNTGQAQKRRQERKRMTDDHQALTLTRLMLEELESDGLVKRTLKHPTNPRLDVWVAVPVPDTPVTNTAVQMSPEIDADGDNPDYRTMYPRHRTGTSRAPHPSSRPSAKRRPRKR